MSTQAQIDTSLENQTNIENILCMRSINENGILQQNMAKYKD